MQPGCVGVESRRSCVVVESRPTPFPPVEPLEEARPQQLRAASQIRAMMSWLSTCGTSCLTTTTSLDSFRPI